MADGLKDPFSNVSPVPRTTLTGDPFSNTAPALIATGYGAFDNTSPGLRDSAYDDAFSNTPAAALSLSFAFDKTPPVPAPLDPAPLLTDGAGAYITDGSGNKIKATIRPT
jgi:hypothetical protein